MSRISQCISTPIDSSIPFSILDLKAQAVRLPVSKGAQILLSELLTWSGERGYCWWSVSAIAKDLKWSTTVVWRKSVELQKSGLLVTIPRPGRSNYWVPLPGPAKMARLKNELTPLADSRPPLEKKKENSKALITFQPPDHEYVPATLSHPTGMNDNASKISDLESRITKLEQAFTAPESKAPISEGLVQSPNPQRSSSPAPLKANLSPVDRLLLQDIEETCHDYHSRGCFIKIIREYPEEMIRAALSVTRDTLITVSGTNGGAYFQATLRGMTPVCTAEESPQSNSRLLHSSTDTVTRQKALCVQPRDRTVATQALDQTVTTPPLPEPEQPDPAALIKGWRLLYEPGNVQRMLSGIKRCFSQCDVHKVWENLKAEMIHLTEEGLVSEFLDLMAMKACYGTAT